MPRDRPRKHARTDRSAHPAVVYALAFMLAVIGYPCHIAKAGIDDAIVMSPAFGPLHSDDRGYYVEFRARTDDEFGHSYVVLGAVDGQGRGRRLGTVGFGTATGAPSGLLAIFGSPTLDTQQRYRAKTHRALSHFNRPRDSSRDRARNGCDAPHLDRLPAAILELQHVYRRDCRPSRAERTLRRCCAA